MRGFFGQQLPSLNVSALGHPDAYMTYHMTSEKQQRPIAQGANQQQVPQVNGVQSSSALPKLLS